MSILRDLGRPDVRYEPRLYREWNVTVADALEREKERLFGNLREAVLAYRAERSGLYKEYLHGIATQALVTWMDAYDAYKSYMREGDR